MTPRVLFAGLITFALAIGLGLAVADPYFAAYDGPVIVMCQEGYSSSMAAATLQRLGFTRATDMVGGFEAWTEAGLPTEPLGPAIE